MFICFILSLHICDFFGGEVFYKITVIHLHLCTDRLAEFQKMTYPGLLHQTNPTPCFKKLIVNGPQKSGQKSEKYPGKAIIYNTVARNSYGINYRYLDEIDSELLICSATKLFHRTHLEGL